MTYAASLLCLSPVEPSSYVHAIKFCPCGGRNRGCTGWTNVRLPVPPPEARTAGMAFRTHRVALGLPRAVAADRLGIAVEQLVELERGLLRCDWAAARAALQWRGRAAA